jgi:hypothetical protein
MKPSLTRLVVTTVKHIVAALLMLLWPPKGASAQMLTSVDTDVIRAVLQGQVLPDLIRNWQLTTHHEIEIVVSNRTRPCALPTGESEARRLREAEDRAIKGERIDDGTLRSRPPTFDQDLQLESGRIIPKDIVAGCWRNSGGSLLPSLRVATPLQLTFERASIVEKEFRKKPQAWRKRHPQSVGVIFMASPVYSFDRELAAVSFTRLHDGIGGGMFFCILARETADWRVLWQETILIE